MSRQSSTLGRGGDRTVWPVYVFVAFFVFVVGGIFFSVLVNSLGGSWFGGWLPEAFTTKWYAFAIDEFDLWQVLQVTLVALSVVALSLLLGVLAALRFINPVQLGRARQGVMRPLQQLFAQVVARVAPADSLQHAEHCVAEPLVEAGRLKIVGVEQDLLAAALARLLLGGQQQAPP
jgi:hypothetical protein